MVSRQVQRADARAAAKARGTDKVCISWLTGGHPAAGFVASVSDLHLWDAAHDHRIVERIQSHSSPRIAAARNGVVRTFLRLDNTIQWHLWVDDDMTFPGWALDRMLQTAGEFDAGIVGGLAFVGGRGSNEMYPTIYALSTRPEDAVKLRLQRYHHYPKDGVIACDATGAAAMLVHRSVYTRMFRTFGIRDDGSDAPFPWFAEGEHEGFEYGEDVTFCLRARQLGIRLVVDTRVKFGHVKTHELDEALFERKLADEGEPPLANAADHLPIEEVFDIAGPIAEMTKDTVDA